MSEENEVKGIGEMLRYYEDRVAELEALGCHCGESRRLALTLKDRLTNSWGKRTVEEVLNFIDEQSVYRMDNKLLATALVAFLDGKEKL